MKQVVYAGPAHTRGLTADNIRTWGVDQKKDWEFPKGEPVEVSDKLADLLIRSGEFDAYEEPPVTEVVVDDESSASSDEGSSEEGPQEHADANG